jgi:hypothetical protein
MQLRYAFRAPQGRELRTDLVTDITAEPPLWRIGDVSDTTGSPEKHPVAWARVERETPAVPGNGKQEPFRLAIWPFCAGLAVLAACSSATRSGGTGTVPPSAPTTVPGTAAPATATTADPWAVPATITPEYLDRVLAELDHIDGDAFRDARAHNAVTPTFIELEGAIRAGPHELAFQEKEVDTTMAVGWKNIKEMPGDRVMTVESLLTAPPPCVLAAVAIDFSPRTVSKPVPYPQWYAALVPSQVNKTNPTHWSLADDGFEPDGGPPSPDQACAVS